ncbi:hypothetical protein MTR_2g034495 [Medicago truncatula]|uniref:Uncharacterized protein n=1 Tax=Medicago truncatula TaxID=3880 RepID=A0A072V551_MEDTR|nr:hypothetical protein MTR_2g034495 [Medicago truncatula]
MVAMTTGDNCAEMIAQGQPFSEERMHKEIQIQQVKQTPTILQNSALQNSNPDLQ